MTFGERLKYLREERGIRQKDVAEAVNISPRMIGYYEANQHFPGDPRMLIKLSELFGVSLDYLFGKTKVRDNKTFSMLSKEFSTLSEENQNDVLDYIKYLKTKY